VEVGIKLQRRSSDVGHPREPGMANKENELACSDDVWGNHCNDNCGLPVNSAEASKMAGASSKYSDFTEVRSEAEEVAYLNNVHLVVLFKNNYFHSLPMFLNNTAFPFVHCLSMISYQRTMKL